jgi:hypothetical protein
MAALRPRLVALLILAGALWWSGCGTGNSTDDSKIVDALHLKRSGSGYVMDDNPFCRIPELLNDGSEVEDANDQNGLDFVIASPDGEVGVLAHPPFAAACKRQATDALKRLQKQSQKGG